MKTKFAMKASAITLKEYDYQIHVYPGMRLVLKDKEYMVQHATLSLDKDEVTVIVERATT